MTKRCFIDSDCVEAVESAQRRVCDRRAHSERRGTKTLSLVSTAPRPYSFRTFEDRRLKPDRRRQGQRVAETLHDHAVAVTAGFESRRPPKRSGEIRILSVRRLSAKAKVSLSSKPSPRGVILDWEG